MSACEGCRWHEITEPDSFGLTSFCRLFDEWAFSPPEECPWRDFDMEAHRVCGNCDNYLGGGDWGLACRKRYMAIPTRVSDATKCSYYRVNGES